MIGLVALVAAACAREEEGRQQPITAIRFPSGVALSPEDPSIPQQLLVVSSNFDLRFRAGVLHAFDRATLDRLADDAPPSPACPAANPRCLPADVPDIAEALVGAVEIGDFGGQVAVAALGDGALRAFVPVRGNHTVVAAELGASSLQCTQGGGTDCVGTGAEFPRDDPYSVVTALGNLYVGHFTVLRSGPKGGVIGTAPVDAGFWTTGGGILQAIQVANRSAIGGLAVGGCRDEDGAPTCTLFASGRSRFDGTQPIFAFDFREGEPMVSPLFSRNLFAQERGFDSRGIASSSSGSDVFLASRMPDALAIIDVSRLAQLPTDGCVLPEGDVVAPGAACPDLPPSTGDRPAFTTADLIPSPAGPNTLATLPRTMPDGSISDLIVMTTTEGLAFFDTRVGVLAATLGGLGGAPTDIAFRPLGDGFRIYAPAFSRGSIAVVDLPDPFRPESATLRARLGPAQESGL